MNLTRFLPKMTEFYVIIARKNIFFTNFWGVRAPRLLCHCWQAS